MFNSGIRGRRAKDVEGVINPQSKYIQTTYPQPSISGYTISGVDDLALDPAGGQTVIVNGTGFATGVSATLGGTQIGAVTFINSKQISFTAPAKSAGSYSLVVYNTSGGAAILVPGITYSGIPTFTTAAGSIGSVYEASAINTSVVATSDSSLTYTLSSGTLPVGATLSSSGVITGTAPASSGSTTYTFSITATDAELQDVTRTFTLTVNTDVVTWVTPSPGSTIQLDGSAYSQALTATDAANFSVSYTANTLPTGLTLTSGTISGTPTVEGTTSTLLTATAASSNRSATSTITWVVSLGDTYWKVSTLLLTANAQNTFITDASSNNALLTTTSTARADNFNPSQLGYYSVYFSGSNFLQTPNSSSFNFGTGDFTIEWWQYITGTFGSQNGLEMGQKTSDATNGWVIYRNNSTNTDKYTLRLVTGDYSSTKVPGTSVWEHWCVTRSSGTLTWYCNGVACGTYSATANITDAGDLYIGRAQTWSTFAGAGYYSNIRIVNGTSLYSNNFTPSTTPLTVVANTKMLTCQSNNLIDLASNSTFTVTGGSIKISPAHPFATVYQPGALYYSTYFNGSSDYLTTPNNAAVQFGSGDFTVECWVLPTAYPASSAWILGQTSSSFGASNSSFGIQIGSTGAIDGHIASGGTFYDATSAAGAIVLKQWSHVAFVRDGTTNRIYVNGVQQGSVAVSTVAVNVVSYNFSIGRDGEYTTQYFTGYISNVRIVKGTCLYPNGTTFTPSTSPLTAISGTTLLTCRDSTIKDISTNNLSLTQGSTTVKPVAIFPFVQSSYTNNPITTRGSVYTGGSSSVVPQAITLSGDFTVECWFYLTASGLVYPVIFSSNTFYARFGDTGFNFKLQFATVDTSASTVYSTQLSQTDLVNLWTHMAFVRSSGVNKIYINGVQQMLGTGGPASTFTTPSWTDSTTIGSSAWSIASGPFAGYVSDFRVSTSAIYTTNFVPPINSQLTSVTSTKLLTLQSNINTTNSNFKDESTFGNIITRNGDTTNSSVSPYGDNWSLYTNGTSSYAYVPYNSTRAIGTNDFSVECWFNVIKQPADYTRLCSIQGNWGYAGNIGVELSFSTVASPGIQVVISGNSTTYYSADALSSGSLWQNNWCHVVATRQSGTLRIFLNGVLKGVATGATTNVNGTAPTSFGTNSQLGGDLTEVNISNWRLCVGSVPTSYQTSSTTAGQTIFTSPTTPLTLSSQGASNTQMLLWNNNRFMDSGPGNYSITTVSNPAIQKFSPFGSVTVPKYYSTYFNGSSDYLTVPSSTPLTFGTNNYTIECWVYWTGSAWGTYGEAIFDMRPDSTNGSYVIVGVSTSGTPNHSSGSNSVAHSTVLAAGQWYHLAFVRNNGFINVYVNGVGTTPVADSTTLTVGNPVKIGANAFRASATTTYWTGYISNFRVINNQALYTGNFTPATTPLTISSVGTTGVNVAASLSSSNVALLTCQNNTFTDISTNNVTITAATTTIKPLPISPFTPTSSSPTNYSTTTFGGSMYFDGTGDYVSVPYSKTFGFTGDFTAECWIYWNSTSHTAYAGIMSCAQGTGWSGWQIIYDNTNNYFRVECNNALLLTGSAITIVPYTWYHIAFVRSGTACTLYYNGVPAGTATSSATIDSTNASLIVGAERGANAFFLGYIADVRVTNGVALYKANFYPGPAPLTSTTTIGKTTYSSSLLLNGTSGGFVDQTRTLSLETFGDARVVNFSPYNGSYYSIQLNGSTDFINSSSASTSFAIGTGDVTLEAWFYMTTSSAWQGIVSTLPVTTGTGIGVYVTNTNNIRVTVGNGNAGTDVNSSTTVSPWQWYHVVATRSAAGAISLYINGTSVASGTSSASLTTQNVIVGRTYTDSSVNYMSGYISNVRVSNTVRTISVPSSPYNSDANTLFLVAQSNKFVDNGINALTLGTGGSPKVATQNPFQVNTGTSMYFDGTGDYLASSTPTVMLGTGNFTIEGWFYVSSSGVSNNGLFQISSSIFSGSNNIVITTYSGNICVGVGTNLAPSIGVAAKTNQWTHYALVRESGVDKFYLNGVLQTGFGTSGSQTDGTDYGSRYITIGGHSTGTLFIGYIADFRITKYARYTATFTPPTAPAKIK